MSKFIFYTNTTHDISTKLLYHYIITVKGACLFPKIAVKVPTRNLLKLVPNDDSDSCDLNGVLESLKKNDEDFERLKSECPDLNYLFARIHSPYTYRPDTEFYYILHRCCCDDSEYNIIQSLCMNTRYEIRLESFLNFDQITIFIIVPIISEEYKPAKMFSFPEEFYEPNKKACKSLQYIESYITYIPPKSCSQMKQFLQPEFNT